MAELFDFALVLDRQSRVQEIQYPRTDAGSRLFPEVSAWRGLTLPEIPDTVWNLPAGTMTWGTRPFWAQEFSPAPGLRCVLLRRRSPREQLMEAALDLIPDCVQLYDANAEIQFLNRSCKELLDIPWQENLEGQNLLDIFAVNPDYSTTLTALRTRKPVRNRFDSYKSATGKDLLTLNTALPLLRDGELLGAVVFERDISTINRVLQAYQNIQQTLTRQLPDSLHLAKDARYTLDDLVGSDQEFLLAKVMAAKMAAKDMNILIQGETGTGKEIFAQGIHAASSRRNGKFVAVNCAAFPESLIEGMLFGTTKGAFTGSVDRVGLIEEADHGTLFLDEVNSMSLGMQAKLLRVLQEKNFRRVGSTRNISVDVRVISSCNEDAFALSERGLLRRDLFYRLASVVVEIPPLRERKGDLEELTWHYIRQNEDRLAQPIREISPSFWERIHRHDWPGNVRELFHILDYAINDCDCGVLREEHLPAYFRSRGVGPISAPPPEDSCIPQIRPDLKKGLAALVREYEKSILQEAYLSCGRNVSQAAELLKISRQNFQYHRKKLGLSTPDS